MGVKHARDALYSVKSLFMHEICNMCRRLAAESNLQTPTIDVDCSNVCFKVGKNAQSVANLLTKWSRIGAKIAPVCDRKCPISNHATNEHEANCERNHIKADTICVDILSLKRKLKTESLTAYEKKKTSKKKWPRSNVA